MAAAIDLSIVTYEPDVALLRQLLGSLAEPLAVPATLNLFIQDHSPGADLAERLRAWPELQPGGTFTRVEVHHDRANRGFGAGHNANAARGAAPFFLILNPDCILEPGALSTLIETAQADEATVAAWEMRQIPYEHPKAYDPVTLETPWVSGAAVLVRRTAFEAVRGFDEHIFLYGEDVDLSWRLRAAGSRLRYVPKAAIVHRTYAVREEVKPRQVFGSVFANLALRARYGGLVAVLRGISMWLAEMLSPASFRGRRRGIARAGLQFLRHAPHFLLTRVRPEGGFRPHFDGWGYEERRDGAFHELSSRRDAPYKDGPLVSILIRTFERPAWLREALASCANQTWPHLEVIVVEDGPSLSRVIVDEFADRLTVRYFATGEPVGRSRAGNLALREARGEWLNFLDDDDVLFADHVEVLVEAARREGVLGAYGLAWETHTHVVEPGDARYEETRYVTRYRQRFDRITLWHHNYLPIQSVLFHRSLWEKHGGFAEDMEQLEDWNLWTRYTLEDDFVLVDKTTSKYRVPADARRAAVRQDLLDRAYAEALERQRRLRLTLSPRDVAGMAESYLRSQSMVMVTRGDVQRFVLGRRWLQRVAQLRHPARAFLRRHGYLR